MRVEYDKTNIHWYFGVKGQYMVTWGVWGHEVLGQWSWRSLCRWKYFFNIYILINFKVVMQVHHNSSHIWLFGVKTIVVISNNDSDLYSYRSCTRRRHIFRPRVVEYPSSLMSGYNSYDVPNAYQIIHSEFLSLEFWVY